MTRGQDMENVAVARPASGGGVAPGVIVALVVGFVALMTLAVFVFILYTSMHGARTASLRSGSLATPSLRSASLHPRGQAVEQTGRAVAKPDSSSSSRPTTLARRGKRTIVTKPAKGAASGAGAGRWLRDAINEVVEVPAPSKAKE